MPGTTLYLIRHAESAPDFSIAESDWPLTPNGFEQARRLAARLFELAPTQLVSSPYRRAIATLEPFASATGMPIRADADLRERDVRDGWVANWDAFMRTMWADLDARMPNCESGTECQRRVTRCLTTIADAPQGQTVFVSSHGNAIALFLNGIDASFRHDAWKQMRNASVLRVRRRNAQWEWDRGFTLDGDESLARQ